MRLFVVLALHTTKRSNAILALRWEHINDDLIHFGQGVGNKRRGDVPINVTLADALAAARERATTEYVIEYGGKPVRSVKKGFQTACRRAGLADVTPHTLRHTGATWMAMAGVKMEEIARVLGNSVAVCERIYAKYHPDYLRRAVSALEDA
jgi:integrase